MSRRQRILCGALGGIAAVVLIAALVQQGKGLRFWNSDSPGSGTDIIHIGPPIDAVVQAVRSEERLVVLSVGTDQKVREGFQFTIYRRKKFVGKVQVIKVYEDVAGGRILFTQRGESIQVGDQATTQP